MVYMLLELTNVGGGGAVTLEFACSITRVIKHKYWAVAPCSSTMMFYS